MDERSVQPQKEGDSDQQAGIQRDPSPSTSSTSKKHGHLRSRSLDTNRLAGASKTPQSFGARFNKVPNSISTHGSTRSADMTRGPVMGTFRVGRYSDSQDLAQNPQDEQYAHTPIITQHQDLPVWRKLPEPSQSGQSMVPAQLARLPPLRNMVSERVPHGDQNLLEATHQSISSGKIGAIANRTPLASMHFETADHQSLGDSRPVNLGVSNPSRNEFHQNQPIAQTAGNFIIRSEWCSGQETFSGYARHDPGLLQSSLQGPNNSSGRMGGSVDLDQARIRKAYIQYRREQTEGAKEQNQPTRQDTVGQDENPQRPMLGDVQSLGPAVFPPLPAIHEGQTLGHFESRRNTPTPPMAFYQPHPYLLSPALSLPKNSPLTPSFLDPVLIPQTYDAMFQRYQQNKVVINRWIYENEHYYADFSAKFRSQQRMLGSMNSPYFYPHSDPRSGPPLSSNHGSLQETHIRSTQVPIYQAQEPAREPMPGPSSRDMVGSMAPPGPYYLNTDSVRSHNTSPPFGNRQNPPHVGSGLREVQNIQPSPPKAHKKRGSPSSISEVPKGRKPRERKGKGGPSTSSTVSAQEENAEAHLAKERGIFFGKFDSKQSSTSGTGSSKHDEASIHDETSHIELSSYADEIAAADLPPPTISEAALRAAGITPKPKLIVQAPAKHRGRTRKTQFPAGGLRVSESLLPALIAGGAQELPSKDRYAATKATYAAAIGVSSSLDVSSNATVPSSGHIHTQNEAESKNNNTDSFSSAQFSESSLRSGISKMRDDGKARRKKATEQQKSASNKASISRPKSNSPDAADDPRDHDFGTRIPGGRKAVNAGAINIVNGTPSRSHRSATATRKTSSVPAKRRSSTAASESAGKRSRHLTALGENQETERAVSELPSSGAP